MPAICGLSSASRSPGCSCSTRLIHHGKRCSSTRSIRMLRSCARLVAVPAQSPNTPPGGGGDDNTGGTQENPLEAIANALDDPIMKKAAREPVAFMGGLFAGLLRLDVKDDPLAGWVERTSKAAGVVPPTAGSGSSASTRKTNKQTNKQQNHFFTQMRRRRGIQRQIQPRRAPSTARRLPRMRRCAALPTSTTKAGGLRRSRAFGWRVARRRVPPWHEVASSPDFLPTPSRVVRTASRTRRCHPPLHPLQAHPFLRSRRWRR